MLSAVAVRVCSLAVLAADPAGAGASLPVDDPSTWVLKALGLPAGAAIVLGALAKWVVPPILDKWKELNAARAEQQTQILGLTRDLQKGQFEINTSQQALTSSLTQAHASAGELIRNCERLHDKMKESVSNG